LDLRERRSATPVRHPWELARLDAIRFLLRTVPLRGSDIHLLDVGCGDGFLCLELRKTLALSSVTAVDTGLADDEAIELTDRAGGLIFQNHFRSLKQDGYDVVLLLDVLEHVPDDEEFLREISGRYLAGRGVLLITVPAFPFLYGPHDRFLGHRRRYRLGALHDKIRQAGLERLESGYLFFSLLPLRFLSSLLARIFGERRRRLVGVGDWRAGKFLASIAAGALRADLSAAIFLNRLGIRIPGLSAWALCGKQR
jgi:SAM-dependent methyltransferase